MWSRLVAWFLRTVFRVRFEETPVLPSPPSDLDVADAYVRSGLEFGEAVAFFPPGACDGFSDLLDAWEGAERAYVDAGFRALPLEAFVRAAEEEDEPLEGLFQRRPAGEEPALHAPHYRERLARRPPDATPARTSTKGA